MIGASTSKDCTKTTSLLCVDAASTDNNVTALYEVAVDEVAVYVAVEVVVEVEEVELNDSSVALGALMKKKKVCTEDALCERLIFE